MLYFEDLKESMKFSLGTHTVSREEILEFAKKYDPQPFHIDEDAASKSHFGGLIASGWHTNAIYMKLFVESIMTKAHGRGSPGIEELRWKKPVRPGDTLSGEFTILEKKPFKGGMGLVRAENKLTNQNGQVVMSFVGLMLFQCAPE